MKRIVLCVLSLCLVLGVFACKHRTKDTRPNPSAAEPKYVTAEELEEASKNIKLQNETAVNQMLQTLLANYVTKDDLNSVLADLNAAQANLQTMVDTINASLQEQINNLNSLNAQLLANTEAIAKNKEIIDANKTLITSLENKIKDNKDAVDKLANNLQNTIESTVANLPQEYANKLTNLANKLKAAATPDERVKIGKEIEALFTAPDWISKKLAVQENFFETGHPTYFKVNLGTIAYKDGVRSLTQLWNNNTKKFEPTIYSTFDDFITTNNKTYVTRAQVASEGAENTNAYKILNEKFNSLFESPIMSSFAKRNVSTYYSEATKKAYTDASNYYVKATDASGVTRFVAQDGKTYAYYAAVSSVLTGIDDLILKDGPGAEKCGTLRYTIYDPNSSSLFIKNDEHNGNPIFRNIIRLTISNPETGAQNVLETPTCAEVSRALNTHPFPVEYEFILYNKTFTISYTE